jgi:hypothetical protein
MPFGAGVNASPPIGVLVSCNIIEKPFQDHRVLYE